MSGPLDIDKQESEALYMTHSMRCHRSKPTSLLSYLRWRGASVQPQGNRFILQEEKIVKSERCQLRSSMSAAIPTQKQPIANCASLGTMTVLFHAVDLSIFTRSFLLSAGYVWRYTSWDRRARCFSSQPFGGDGNMSRNTTNTPFFLLLPVSSCILHLASRSHHRLHRKFAHP